MTEFVGCDIQFHRIWKRIGKYDVNSLLSQNNELNARTKNVLQKNNKKYPIHIYFYFTDSGSVLLYIPVILLYILLSVTLKIWMHIYYNLTSFVLFQPALILNYISKIDQIFILPNKNIVIIFSWNWYCSFVTKCIQKSNSCDGYRTVGCINVPCDRSLMRHKSSILFFFFFFSNIKHS